MKEIAGVIFIFASGTFFIWMIVYAFKHRWGLVCMNLFICIFDMIYGLKLLGLI